MACTGSEYEQGTVRVRRFLNEWKISLLKITLSGEERNWGKWERLQVREKHAVDTWCITEIL